jgi:hypothetical protein
MKTTKADPGLIIEIPPFNGDEESFREKVIEQFGQDPDIIRVMTSTHLGQGLQEVITVRLVTPEELGHADGLTQADCLHTDVLKKHNLTNCLASTPMRLALEFEKLRPNLPAEYVRKSGWWTHMFLLTDVKSNDKFINGYGLPKPILAIKPVSAEPQVLEVQWIYEGKREKAFRNQPMLFQQS